MNGIKRCKRINGYFLLRAIQMSLQRQMTWELRLVWPCTAEVNEKFKRAGWRHGQDELWHQASRIQSLQKWTSLSNPLSEPKAAKACLWLKGGGEDNCGNLQRICFNFCWKDSKSFVVWTYGFWGEGSELFQCCSFEILLIIRNKYGLNTRAVMKRDDFLVKLLVVCILVIIQQMNSTCCTSPSTYRWDWNISWIYILFGLTKPGFEFKGQWRN